MAEASEVSMAAAVETVASEETARTEAELETREAVEQIHAQAEVEIAETQAQAAVAIAEAQAEAMEIDDVWLQSRFDAVEDALAKQRLQLEEILSAIAAIATVLLTASPAPSIPTPPPQTPPPEAPPPTPPASGDVPPDQEKKRRIRRLM